MIVYGKDFIIDATFISISSMNRTIIRLENHEKIKDISFVNRENAEKVLEYMQQQFAENGEIDLRGKY